ncbi:site-specific DNA-methyltransferase [Rhodanobacter sp. 115]|uniref:DNA-methyltransferase n=1 Tax=Rhodanobacter sp. FW021-MT20 TaxID=1162282 RepID=UPI0034E4B84D
MTAEIRVGNCMDVMHGMQDSSVDAVVTDPPYGLGFMGKDWDRGVPGVAYWAEMLRVAKPGAYMLAFGGSRTYHRMVCAIEDAGWEIRDEIAYFYDGTERDAFLDSLDERQREAFLAAFGRPSTVHWVYGSGFPKSHNGPWGGTALKPAHEPIVVARKPLMGTVAANHAAFGTGALNIDASRIASDATEVEPRGRAGEPSSARRYTTRGATNIAAMPGPRGGGAAGRWPANVIHDGSDGVVANFPREAGAFAPVLGCEPSAANKSVFGQINRHAANAFHGDRGSAARFFYCAKADRADRDDGCEGLPPQALRWSDGDANPGSFQSEGTMRAARNHHPTVKPTDLMRYLCRLVTPAGGLVLDPFAGSGSTGRGAVAEGYRFLGIELSPTYADIARRRIAAIQPGLPLEVTA